MTEPAGQPADIIELILADHRRIGRLCHALYDTARHDGGPRPDWMPGHMWQRLADLLVAHTRAEEETWYRPLFGTGPQVAERIRDSIADHDEIRGLSMSRRRELGRQWCAFMAAWRPEVPAR